VASSSHFQSKEMYKYVFFLAPVVLRAGVGKLVTSPVSKPLQLLVLRRVFILSFFYFFSGLVWFSSSSCFMRTDEVLLPEFCFIAAFFCL